MIANANSSALQEATRLLREGQYSLASEWLDKAVAEGECSLAQALDLRARGNAQQGFALEAERLWREALALEPDNPDYQQGLDALRSPYRRYWLSPVAMSVSIVAIALSLYVLIVALPGAAHESRMGHQQTASLMAKHEQHLQAHSTRVEIALREQAEARDTVLASHVDTLAKQLRSELAQARSAQHEALHTVLQAARQQQSETLAAATASIQASLQQARLDSRATREAIEALSEQFPQLALDLDQAIAQLHRAQADALAREAASRGAELQATLRATLEHAFQDRFDDLQAQAQQAGAQLLTRLTEEMRLSLVDAGDAERAQLQAMSMGLEALRIQLDAIASQLAPSTRKDL